MKLYTVHIHETTEELCVAARSNRHASEVLTAFWFSRCGSAPGDFDVEPGAPAAYRNHPALRRIAAGEVAGVVVRQLDGCMLFEPASS